MKSFPILYKKTSNGSIQQWQAVLTETGYYTIEGLVNGKLTTSGLTTTEAKNTGKANETSIAAQAEKEIEALYVKKLKSNYFNSIEETDQKFLEPQLAKPCKDYIDKVSWKTGQIVDHKLNGVACILKADGMFSRKNEKFHSAPHISKDLEKFFQENPTAYLQGELFSPANVNHLEKTIELIAVTRKPKDIDANLLKKSEENIQYHVYDGYGFEGTTKESSGLERRNALKTVINKYAPKYCKLVEYKLCFSMVEMQQVYNKYVGEGGEGVIIRNPSAPYQHKRTKDLLKFKKSEDAEFKVLDFEEGNGNWKGMLKAVWCELPNGNKFKSNVDGEQSHCKMLWETKEKYVGKLITVRFQEYSSYGVPLIPYTNMITRDYE